MSRQVCYKKVARETDNFSLDRGRCQFLRPISVLLVAMDVLSYFKFSVSASKSFFYESSKLHALYVKEPQNPFGASLGVDFLNPVFLLPAPRVAL